MRILNFISLVIIAASPATSAQASGIADILSMQNWKNSSYQAICADGSFETVDNIDLKIDNACPKLDLNRANNILVLHQLVDLTFDVTCVDLTRYNVSADQVIDGSVCENSALVEFGSGDALNGQLRTDGNFDLVCTDGSKEVVSPRDIRLNNICPRQNVEAGPRTMLTMFQSSSENFTVHCSDGTSKEASVDEIKENTVCPPVPMGTKAGEYKVESGYSSYCRQRMVPSMVNNLNQSIRISFIGSCSGTTFTYTCAEQVCTTADGKYRATLMDETHYKFERTTDNATAIFVFDGDIKEMTAVARTLEETIGEK